MGINAELLQATAAMPMKQIDVNGKPYLQRYFAGENSFFDVWVHRFLSEDGDRHLHNHPFDSSGFVLAGGYVEECINFEGKVVMCWRTPTPLNGRLVNHLFSGLICEVVRLAADDLYSYRNYYRIGPFDFHRIAKVEPGTWTVLAVRKQRLPFWYFKEGDEYVPVKSSPRDWWKTAKTRAEQAAEGVEQ